MPFQRKCQPGKTLFQPISQLFSHSLGISQAEEECVKPRFSRIANNYWPPVTPEALRNGVQNAVWAELPANSRPYLIKAGS